MLLPLPLWKESSFLVLSYQSVFWLKKQGLMPSHRFSKELISTDYGLHCGFSCLMSKHLVHKTSEQRVKGIITSAVRMEQRFLLDAFAGKLPGMNYSLMKQYTEFVTDLLLLDLGLNRVFRGENPFDFTESLSRQGRTNFFVKKRGDSQGLGGRPWTTEIFFFFTLYTDF